MKVGSKMKVLVTGGAGFIGSFVLDALMQAGHEPVVVDSLISGRKENLPQGVKLHQIDIASPALLDVMLHEKPEVVLHLAAQVSVQRSMCNPVHDAAVNLIGSLQVLNACVLAACRKVIYTSSAAVYGDPSYLPVDEQHPIRPCSPYGVSKHTVEHYLPIYKQVHGLDFTVLRLANVYGPRQELSAESGVTTAFVNRFIHGQPLQVQGDGEQTRDFVYVQDVARAHLLALDQGNGETVNIGTGIETSINQLLDELCRANPQPATVQHVPARAGDIRRSVLGCDRVKQVLGFAASYSLHDGLSCTVAWARQQG